MPIEYYEWLTQKLEAFQETAVSHEAENIRYWVLEFEMLQEAKDTLEKIARENEMTVDEFFETTLLSALRHPEEAAKLFREQEAHPNEDCGIRLVRQYPVYKWETEVQARKQAIAAKRVAIISEKMLVMQALDERDLLVKKIGG